MAIGKAHELLPILSRPHSRPMMALVHGNDRSAVYDLCQSSVTKIIGPSANDLNLTRLTEQQITSAKDRLHEEFASISMFGGERAIWISGCGDATAKIIEPLLASEVNGNFILMDAESLTKTSKLRKLVEAHSRAICVALYEESNSELQARLERQIKEAGLKITADALEKLLLLISFERGVADSETQKLLTYCYGQAQIEVEDVMAICGDTSEVSTDDLVDAIFEGNLEDADRFAANYAASLGSGRSSLSLVLQHVVKLESMSAQISQGVSIDSIVSSPRFGIFFKRRGSIARQLRVWDAEALLSAEEKICSAILQTRQYADLADAIENRTILALSRVARSRQSSVN